MPEGGAYNQAYDFLNEHHSLVDLGAGEPTDGNTLFIQQTSRGYRVDEPAVETQPTYDTDATAPGTDAQAPGTNSVGMNTDNATSTTSSALATTDIRPQFTGLLYIMKVRY